MTEPVVDYEPYMLTTVDNPWNPWTHWDDWYEYDRAKGYFTPEFLARITNSSFDLSDSDQELAVTQAIDEIVEINVLGLYKKIRRND